MKKKISLVILLFINFIFILKYSNRYSDYYILISFLIISIQLVILKYHISIFKFLKKIKITPVLILVLFCVLLLTISNEIPLAALKIDRWSVITSFWDNYFNDLYVYNAKSFDGNPPGPMPFYFFLMLPFYMIKEFSYVTVISIFIFYSLLKSKEDKNFYITIIITSVFITYEVVARSNIFFNSTLILLSLLYFLKNEKKSITKGIIIGLLLSTRNVYGIVYGIAFLFLLKKKKENLKELLLIGTIAIITFVVTFLPFTYNFMNEFWEINPFKIQSSALLPFNYSISCILLSLAITLFIKKKEEIPFYAGISLFLTIVVYFIYWIFNIDFKTTFFDSFADITYFIFCVPFLLYYIITTKNPDTIGTL